MSVRLYWIFLNCSRCGDFCGKIIEIIEAPNKVVLKKRGKKLMGVREKKKCFLSDLLEAAATCIVDDSSSVFVFFFSFIPYLWLPLITD
jgi:hypothetical protein